MLVGVPNEITPGEYRVGIITAAVREYAARGHRVTVETNPGAGIAAGDEEYATGFNHETR